MTPSRPDLRSIMSNNAKETPLSCQRILSSIDPGEMLWIGPDEAMALSTDEMQSYTLAHAVLCHLIVQAPVKHSSGHPGGPLSAFTAAYMLGTARDPHIDQPLRMSPGHLSLLAFGLQWLFGREGKDARLSSPQAIIDTFRMPEGLPGHVEAGIGDIPFGTGPLGKGVSNALGVAFGLKLQRKPGIVDVLLADGDAEEGQVMEAFRLASRLRTDNLIVHGDFNDVQLAGLPSQTMAADFASIAHASGWHVIEVQNGNDPAQCRAALREADRLLGKGKPIFICYYTTMGYGIPFMEEGSNSGKKNYHGAPLAKDEAEKALSLLPNLTEVIRDYEPFRAMQKKRYETGQRVATDVSLQFSGRNLKNYVRIVTKEKGAARSDFGAKHLKALMASDPRIIILHADLAGSGGFSDVAKTFPDRVINVGVAEANMVMMAAGMRQTGLLPVTYTFAAFGTNEARASARLIDINCGHTRCGILMDCTHAGLSVGEDGETHQEQNHFTIPFRHTQVWMPADSNQAGAMAERSMELIAEGHQSVFVFSPRSGHAQLTTPHGDLLYGSEYSYDGKIDLVRGKGDSTDQATILAVGIPVHRAIAAADKLLLEEMDKPVSIRVLNVSCIRPIDASAVIQAALETRHLIVVEDHNVEGGLASQVADVIADFGLPCSLRRLGLTHYFPSATAEQLEFFAGLDTESILQAVLDETKVETRGGEEAFVTAIYELTKNLQQSRFQESAQAFIEKLKSEKGYMDTLRRAFVKRAIALDKLPSNGELLERLGGE